MARLEAREGARYPSSSRRLSTGPTLLGSARDSGCHRSPQPVDGHDVETVGERVGAGSGREDDPGGEPRAKGVAELTETAEVAAGGPFAGFDLEGNDGAVVVLDDHVDFGTVAGPPVSQSHGLVEPGSLLADLPDNEGLQQVPEVGE